MDQSSFGFDPPPKPPPRKPRRRRCDQCNVWVTWTALVDDLDIRWRLVDLSSIPPTSLDRVEADRTGNWVPRFKPGYIVHSSYCKRPWRQQQQQQQGPAPGVPPVLTPEERALRELYLNTDAPEPVIRAVFRALARMYHPDMPGGDAERMKAINAAYQHLQAKGQV